VILKEIVLEYFVNCLFVILVSTIYLVAFVVLTLLFLQFIVYLILQTLY